METTTKTKQQSVFRLLAALFFLCLFAPMAAGQNNWKDHCATQIVNKDGGNGSSWDNAIEIATAEELAYFAQQVNNKASISCGNGNSIGPDDNGQAGGFKDYYFVLAADIDLSDYDWTPIGNATNPFNGNFDGRGHCVNGLKVETVSGSAYAGLFGCTSVGILRNLGVRLADAGIQANSTGGSAYVGGIAGYAHNIFNCYVVGEGAIGVSSSEMGDYIYAGGIVGSLGTNSSLANCYATVNVKVESDGLVYVGGIVGFGNFNSTISHTYATGDVETGTVDYRRYAGGICGYLQTEGTLTNSLAVNGRIIGGDSYSNRIIGHQESKATLDANYASPEIQVNGSVVNDGAGDDVNGNPSVNLGNFGSVLTWGNGWDTRDDTHLPQLKRQTGDDPNYSYIAWPTGEGYTPQPSLDAATYFLPKHILHIVSPTGGTLKVTDKDGNELSDGSKIVSGTLLTLSYTESPNYRFSEYLSGSSADNLRTLSGNTIQISDADLYLSARFNYEDPTPPPPPAPIYYSVFLPSVEGAVTDPVAGTYDVESWSTFRLFLTID
ncbi:GLUG motif-containing protein, partial [Parabacteroides goldsteinii]|uniref:GLUG motif-containing protein n=1 Tax=Parabacteroides goldsteinii TaxID=328812 RepID=UPI00259BE9DE